MPAGREKKRKKERENARWDAAALPSLDGAGREPVRPEPYSKKASHLSPSRMHRPVASVYSTIYEREKKERERGRNASACTHAGRTFELEGKRKRDGTHWDMR